MRTITNIADIQKYTEQSLIKLSFKVTCEKITKLSADHVDLNLLKA